MASSFFVSSSSSASELNSIVFGRLAGVYRDPSRIIRDAASLRSTDLGSRLHPLADPLIMNDESELLVLMLKGTLPMTYRGSEYNIPIDLYVPPQYPVRPPIIYVRPARNMTIKVNHVNVGQDGMVYMPYLHNWNADTHDLTELAILLSSIFGDEPPCYRRNNIERERADAINAATLTVKLAMESLFDRARAELRIELMDQKRLEAGKKRIDVLLEEGEKQKANLVTENAELEKSTRVLQRWLTTVKEEKQRRRGPVYDNEEGKRREDWDECGAIIDLIAIPADTRSAQMLALTAESAAIDDCIYYLDMALEGRKLTMEVYLREVRKLTKRQFLAKVNRLCYRMCDQIITALLLFDGFPYSLIQRNVMFSHPIAYGHSPFQLA